MTLLAKRVEALERKAGPSALDEEIARRIAQLYATGRVPARVIELLEIAERRRQVIEQFRQWQKADPEKAEHFFADLGLSVGELENIRQVPDEKIVRALERLEEMR